MGISYRPCRLGLEKSWCSSLRRSHCGNREPGRDLLKAWEEKPKELLLLVVCTSTGLVEWLWREYTEGLSSTAVVLNLWGLSNPFTGSGIRTSACQIIYITVHNKSKITVVK